MKPSDHSKNLISSNSREEPITVESIIMKNSKEKMKSPPLHKQQIFGKNHDSQIMTVESDEDDGDSILKTGQKSLRDNETSNNTWKSALNGSQNMFGTSP